MNNPPYFPHSDGGVEKSIRDFESALAQRQQHTTIVPVDFTLEVELTAHELNHRSRRCLKDHTACAVFHDDAQRLRWSRPQRQTTFRLLLQRSGAMIEKTTNGCYPRPATTWWVTVEAWLRSQGLIAVRQSQKSNVSTALPKRQRLMNNVACRMIRGGRAVRMLMRTAGFLLAVTPMFAESQAAASETNSPSAKAQINKLATRQESPTPMPDHPGNVFLAGETVLIPVPQTLSSTSTEWRLVDDRRRVLRTAALSSDTRESREPLQLGKLEIGWYRLEFGTTNQPDRAWTSLAVLRRLSKPVPADSPVAVDSAAAWSARDDATQQKRLANLAALAGVSWVRDRLRWGEIQPQPGELNPPPTTYDTSAKEHRDAGLHVLQVFHETPLWAQEVGDGSGRFAPDLRHVYELGRALAVRFKGRVAAWEPWNEANVATFGAHTVDEMCSWQKAAWLGFKAGDPDVIVGWNPTAGVPTPAHTEGVLANETWSYFDTYNIHTYDWSHSYADLWKPAREAAAGRPIWITEADRSTPHLKNAPWYDQDPRLEQLKAEWMAQSYASSLFSGAQRHFHFILGNYQEANDAQFGLLRLDLTPRPAYVALAAVGRCLAGARSLGRWQPGQQVQVYAFRAKPDGQERDVLVVWAEKEVDWNGRGTTTADWKLPAHLNVQDVVDYLGRSSGAKCPTPLTSAPLFVFLPPGQAASLPLESPPVLAAHLAGSVSSVVLQMALPRSATRKVEDVPWSQGYAYQATPGQSLDFKLHVYNFGTNTVVGRLQVIRQPHDWNATLAAADFKVASMDRVELNGTLRIPTDATARDGWVVLHADCGRQGQPALAFRVVARE